MFKVRLFRPVIHFLSLAAIFFVTYKLRLVTDLIPGIQLRIPPINIYEIVIFAAIASIMFIAIGLLKNLYELHKPLQKYFSTFGKVWIYWTISITFIAYFGQGFVFVGGISRFIIIWTAILALIWLFIIDQIRNGIEKRIHKKRQQEAYIITNKKIDAAMVKNISK